jgi:hypothetical protein
LEGRVVSWSSGCTGFCFKIKTTTYTHKMLEIVSGNEAVSRMYVFELFKRFGE